MPDALVLLVDSLNVYMFSFLTLPLLGVADSETDRVVTPLRVLGGGKSIPRRTTYHRTSLPEFFVDGNTYIYWSNICSTKSRLWRLLIMSSVVHAELVIYTTVVNYYSCLHYSINYDRLSSSLIIPPIS